MEKHKRLVCRKKSLKQTLGRIRIKRPYGLTQWERDWNIAAYLSTLPSSLWCPITPTAFGFHEIPLDRSSEEGRSEVLMYILLPLPENKGMGRRDVGKVGRNPWTTSKIVPVLKLFDLWFIEDWYQNSVSKDCLHSLVPSWEECLAPSFIYFYLKSISTSLYM